MTELAAAFALGVAAGMAPGPLHSLILSTALHRGARPAVRLALAPLISDAPPVLASLFLARTMPDGLARALAVAGGVLVIVLGLTSLSPPDREEIHGSQTSAVGDYLRGAFVNLLNPHPWLFWLGAGAPMLKLAFDGGTLNGLGWLGLFYGGLVGAKAAFAIGVGKGGRVLSGSWPARAARASALLMVGVGGWLVWLGAMDRV